MARTLLLAAFVTLAGAWAAPASWAQDREPWAQSSSGLGPAGSARAFENQTSHFGPQDDDTAFQPPSAVAPSKSNDVVGASFESPMNQPRPAAAAAGPAPLPLNADAPKPISPRAADAPLPLARPGQDKAPAGRSGIGAVLTTFGSLIVCLGLFGGLAWLMRRRLPQGSGRLPREVFESLGKAPLAGRQQVHLIRCGGKLLLISISPSGVDTLTEITDPLEVDRLAGACLQSQPQSSTSSFRQMLGQLANDRGWSGASASSKSAATAGDKTLSKPQAPEDDDV